MFSAVLYLFGVFWELAFPGSLADRSKGDHGFKDYSFDVADV